MRERNVWKALIKSDMTSLSLICIQFVFLEVQETGRGFKEMHANNNDTWLRLCTIYKWHFVWVRENRWRREYKTSDWQRSYITLAVSAHAVNKPQGKTDKTRRCPMAISVKTSSSVSEGNQLVKQLSIKQPLILRGFSHSKYRVDGKEARLRRQGGCVLLPVNIPLRDFQRRISHGTCNTHISGGLPWEKVLS